VGCNLTVGLKAYKPKNIHNPAIFHHCCGLAKTNDWLAYLPAKLPTVQKPSSIGLILPKKVHILILLATTIFYYAVSLQAAEILCPHIKIIQGFGYVKKI